MDYDDDMMGSYHPHHQQQQLNRVGGGSNKHSGPGRGLLSTIHNLFATTNPSVKRLMNMRKCPDDDNVTKRSEKELDYLARKLKRKRGALEELERVVSRDCADQPGRCITLPRSADGRIQVAHYKALPHFIYCRLWRWPNLHSHHELKPMPFCEFPYSSKRDEVCINPYHYNRVGQQLTPPAVLVPNLASSDVDTSSNCSSPEPPGFPQPQQQQQFQGMPRNVDLEQQQPFAACQPSISPNYPTPTMTSCHYASGNTSPEQQVPTAPMPRHNLAYTPMCNTTGFTVKYPNYSPEPYSSHMANATMVAYEEPRDWASIAYYELNTRVGEVFHCTHPIVRVDGYTMPMTDTGPERVIPRFCLGQLTSINRNSSIENVRRAIGEGIQIHNVGSEIYVECHSPHPIFVQSRNYNIEHGHDQSTVVKLQHKGALKIFDNQLFHELLKLSMGKGFESVYELTKMCTIRLSFVKGWGAKYHRQDVTGTPCWIEIHLNGPLRWLDRVLISLGSPNLYISSIS